MIPAVIVAIDVWNYAIYIDRNRVMTAEALGGFGDNDGAHFALLFALSHTKAQFKCPLLTKAPRTGQRTLTFEIIHMDTLVS